MGIVGKGIEKHRHHLHDKLKVNWEFNKVTLWKMISTSGVVVLQYKDIKKTSMELMSILKCGQTKVE